MRKRILSVLLMISLLCGLFAACGKASGPTGEQKDEKYDEYMEAVLTDWVQSISASEAMYTDLDWALSYIDAFANNQTWDALLNARAAVELVIKRTKLREEPEWAAPEEAYSYFMEQEKDISFVQPELESFEYNRNAMLQTCTMLRYDLMTDAFLLDGIPRIADTVTAERDAKKYNLQYLALSTNYLLLELNDTEWAEKVYRSMRDFCPQIAALREGGPTEKDELEAAVSIALDEYSDLLAEQAFLVGRSQAVTDLLDAYVTQGNHADIAAMCSSIDGLPSVLPDPGWELDSGQYFWTDEDGSHRYLTGTEDLTSPPENCVLNYADVTEPEVLEYIFFLNHIGLDGERVDGEDGFYSVCFQTGDSDFVVSWTEKGAAIYMLKGPVCLAPDWFVFSRN